MFSASYFMSIAIEEAKLAAKEGEVPVGAVLEYEGRILAQDHNRMVQRKNALAHAELLVLFFAAGAHPDKWLLNSTLYVTLEPCVMCAGALVLARVQRLYYACSDPKSGACGSVLDIVNFDYLNHRLQVESGLYQDEASMLLKEFFVKLRMGS